MPSLVDTNVVVYRFDPRFPAEGQHATAAECDGVAAWSPTPDVVPGCAGAAGMRTGSGGTSGGAGAGGFGGGGAAIAGGAAGATSNTAGSGAAHAPIGSAGAAAATSRGSAGGPVAAALSGTDSDATRGCACSAPALAPTRAGLGGVAVGVLVLGAFGRRRRRAELG